MAAPGPAPTPRPPGRALLRLAGVLTQLACGVCLLIGTIGLVLVQQNKPGASLPVAGWLATAMAGLVFGGLIYRGGVVSMLVAAAIDAGFGIILITIEGGTLRTLLKILPASDVATIGDGLDVTGFAMIGAGVMCLIALPQGIRFSRWFRDAAATRTARSTARGFPPPVAAHSSVLIIPADHTPAARRRLYLVLGGLAVAVGAGAGLLVSSPRLAALPQVKAGPAAGPGSATATMVAPPVAAPADGGVAAIDARGAAADAIQPPGSVQDLVAAQRAALAGADAKALAALLIPAVFAFGIDADEVTEGRAAVTTQLLDDLREVPAGGFTVESRALSIGEDRGYAWIAEELEISATGRASRTLAISELAAAIAGRWQIVALHWAIPVADATAQRLAILKTLPAPRQIPDRHDGAAELDRAVHAAFASRDAFAAARSERPDAFNYGSGGERARGGVAIKRIFSKLKAELQLHDGARVVDAGAWDPAQRAAPRIGWAAVNVDFTSRTRAATSVTQTLRVLAILIKEGADWKIVQTQWSNGGPFR